MTTNVLVEKFELEHFQFGLAIEGLENRPCKVAIVVAQALESKANFVRQEISIIFLIDFGQKSRLTYSVVLDFLQLD